MVEVKMSKQQDAEDLQFQNSNSILLSRWHLDVEKINLILIFTMMVVEVVFYFLMDAFIAVDAPLRYFTAYLIRPAAYNFLFWGGSKLLYYKKDLRVETQAEIPLVVFTLIMANIIRVHYLFPVVYGLILVPVFLTVLYGNIRITRRVLWTSYAVFTLDVLLILKRPFGGLPELFWLNVLITYVILPFAFLLVKSILRYESMKERIIRDQSIANEELREELLYDGLTKIYNYTGLQTRLHRFVTDYKPQEQLYLAILDIDHFKALNDRYGHPTGNVVLQRLGELLAEERNEHVSVARYGGEEFAVVFQGMSRVECYSVLLSLFRKFQNSKFHGTKIKEAITFSAGLACYKEGMSMGEFIESADAILYQAKRNGRAQIQVEELE